MNEILKFFAVAACLTAPLKAGAQFYLSGTDPASTRWNSISTRSFEVIYPEGCDSLAFRMARTLENVSIPVSGSIGYTPNQFYRKPMPVVLHTGTADANGMVTWAPHRMELYTVPEAYGPEPVPWDLQLAIHESRHASQMQFGRWKSFLLPNILLGELTTGALSALYCGPAFLEGDAVAAETALTSSGRGRTADFLEYYRACFLDGQTRDWWQWRYGSIGRYTPDYYRAGYVSMAGMRTFFDSPGFTAEYYDRLQRHGGVVFRNFRKTVKEAAGMKFDDAWAAITDSLSAIWKAEAEARAPFTEGDAVTECGKYYTSFRSPVATGDGIYAVRSGITEPASLQRLGPDGVWQRVGSFASSSSALKYSGFNGGIYWSERIADPRWEMKSESAIMRRSGGITQRLTKSARFYNPTPAPDGNEIAVTEYPVEGGSSLVILDGLDGSRKWSYPVPDGWQIVESAWIQDRIYVSAITSDGEGIYSIHDLAPVLDPANFKIRQLGSRGDLLTFICDLDGSNELYSLDPGSGELQRLTSDPVGVSDYAFAGDTLYFTVSGSRAKALYRTAVPEGTAADPGRIHRYAMAEELSAGEPFTISQEGHVDISAPARYRKGAHLFRFHSWMPVFVNFDDVSSLSSETLLTGGMVGATAFFQNTLGSLHGLVGFSFLDESFHSDPAFHAKFNWTGWYPVLEASFNMHAKSAGTYTYSLDEENGGVRRTVAGTGIPAMDASVRAYVPLSTSVGGIIRGVIPQVSFGWTSNSISNLLGKDFDPAVFQSRLTASVRGYVMQSVPASCIYPKLGIGGEAGYSGRPAMNGTYCSSIFASVYGYLPGLAPTHGLRLNARVQKRFDDGVFCEPYMNACPRGTGTAEMTSILAGYPVQTLVTADYAMPFARLDWGGLKEIAYVRNLELNPHLDFGWYPEAGKRPESMLYSAGADFNVVLGNILWIPYTTRIGLSFSWTDGNLFSEYEKSSAVTGHCHFGINLSVDL